MPRPPLALRFAALLSVAAIVLHEARYLIGFGGHAGEVLSERGHGYLPLAGVLAMILLAVAAAQLALLVGRARRTGHGSAGGLGLAGTWLLASVALIGVYGGQELLEGLAGGHLHADVLLGDGGLVAVPLAVALGGVVALFMRGAEAAVRIAARRGGPRRPPRARAKAISFPAGPEPRLRASLLALRLAGRAPPLPA